MTMYKITQPATGVCLGTFPGESPEDALDAMSRDAGYENHAEVEALGLGRELVVEEVASTTADDQQEEDYDPSPCTNPGGHKWEYTGTAYGGDDPRWGGDGRCLCVYCGADGDA